MFKIIKLSNKRRKTHIEKKNLMAICGKTFNKKDVSEIKEQNAENCTCEKCLYLLEKYEDVLVG